MRQALYSTIGLIAFIYLMVLVSEAAIRDTQEADYRPTHQQEAIYSDEYALEPKGEAVPSWLVMMAVVPTVAFVFRVLLAAFFKHGHQIESNREL